MLPPPPIVAAWPALLGTDAACHYLSLDRHQFERLTARWHVHPVEAGDGVTLWRRSDFDGLIKRLPTVPLTQASQPVPTMKLDRITIDQIVEGLVARLGSRPAVGGPNAPQFLSIRDTCQRLGLSRTKVYAMIADGTLRMRKFGNRTLVTIESIEALAG